MVTNTNTEALTYVENLLKKKKWDFKTLATRAELSLCTLAGFRKGRVPREVTVKRMAGALQIKPNEILKRLVSLPMKAKKVKITIVCAHCGELGTIRTTRPKYMKYPHKECSKVAWSRKNKAGIESKKKIRDSDRIKMMPQNETYIRNAQAKEKKRTCLNCDKIFLSRDVGNRICKLCTSNLERGTLQDRRHNVLI